MIPLSVPNLSGNEQKYVAEALAEGWVSTAGAFVRRFEEEIAHYAGTPGAVACQSGTAGLHLSLLAAGITAGEYVLCPTLTFVAAVNPIRYVGAEPYFIDCDDSLCIDPEKLARFLEEECRRDATGCLREKKSGRLVRALLLVHVFGNLADMPRILALCERYRLILIEDATEALGSKYVEGELAGRFAGSFGDFGVYSFNGNKIITTGGGGMVVARDAAALEHVRHLSTQAKTDQVYFDHDEVGYNYRMTNVQAAMGVAQLEQLESFITNKKLCYEYYKLEGLKLLPFRRGTRPNYWFFSYLSKKRDALIRGLQAEGIQTRPVWKLIHSLPMYIDSPHTVLDTATSYYEKIVNLPCSSNLQMQEVRQVAEAVLRLEASEV